MKLVPLHTHIRKLGGENRYMTIEITLLVFCKRLGNFHKLRAEHVVVGLRNMRDLQHLLPVLGQPLRHLNQCLGVKKNNFF
jgi:hypothetical protein